jgi:cytochrome c peroxidase
MNKWCMMLVLVLVGVIRLLQPPLGLDIYMPVPEANPLTREKVVLGRKLFFDKRLSRDGTVACASCHDPARAFSDGRTVAHGKRH